MWTWNSDPFGTDAANPNPAGAGTFAYNLRFPGQLFDGQAGLHQNYYRDYDPAIGGYVESDPIGLAAGVNTYAYVGAKPISFADPFGLCPPGTHPATPDDIKKILNEADKIQKKGLTHDQIQCNEFVNQSINAAFPGAVDPSLNTKGLLHGQGAFDRITSPSVGDLALFTDPGHVVFVTGVSDGAVSQFLGSQSSHGPRYVNLPDPYYWTPRFNLPNNVTYLHICLPN
jgi:RHS repeat-associated protein